LGLMTKLTFDVTVRTEASDRLAVACVKIRLDWGVVLCQLIIQTRLTGFFPSFFFNPRMDTAGLLNHVCVGSDI